jgi:hypothetical protein
MIAADTTARLEADVASRLVGRLAGGSRLRVSEIAGGRNSRIYRIDTPDGTFALKRYPPPTDDPRDRLGVETSALRWMASHELDMVPRVLAVDTAANCVLLSWVEGLQVFTVGPDDIDQAIEFLCALETLRHTAPLPAAHLASEACLSGAELERQIRTRLSELDALEGEPELRSVLHGEFASAFEGCLAKAQTALSSVGLSFEAELAREKRGLVPSDFGFHNALRSANGRLIFLDFEYFGWDDPAKLTSDTLLHPGTPIASELRSRFRRAAEKLYGGDPDFSTRLAALYPLFALRWALILLNEFHPKRWRRRILAGTRADWAEAKDGQLRAARAMLMNCGA